MAFPFMDELDATAGSSGHMARMNSVQCPVVVVVVVVVVVHVDFDIQRLRIFQGGRDNGALLSSYRQ
jgi:hypothetical protein